MPTETQQAYQSHLASDYWSEVSNVVKKRDAYRCRVCNSPNRLQVHHRDYAHRGSEMDHLNDLTTLCDDCHALFHAGKIVGPSAVVPVHQSYGHRRGKPRVVFSGRNTEIVTRGNCFLIRNDPETIDLLRRAGYDLHPGWKLKMVGHRLPSRMIIR